jgi:homoserine kinase type II
MAQYVKLQESEIHQIMSEYALHPIDYKIIDGGAGNTSYWVGTIKNQFVLTIFEINPDLVSKVCDLLCLLEKYAFPTTRIQKLANGDSLTSYQGKAVLLKPYIIGAVEKELDATMLEQLGEMMGKLHAIPSPDSLPDRYEYDLQTFPPLTKQGIHQEYENWLAEKYIYLKENISEDLPRGLIHGDLFYDNVLFDGKELKAIIDFETVCNFYQVFDLGMALIGLCLKDSQVDLKKARLFLKGYQKIRTLETQEKESLQLFAEYAAIAISSWGFWKYNIDTPIAEKSEKHMEMFEIANNANAIPNRVFVDTIFG